MKIILLTLLLSSCVTPPPKVSGQWESEYVVKCKVTEYRDFMGFRQFVKVCKRGE